jgi:hypothetical protein
VVLLGLTTLNAATPVSHDGRVKLSAYRFYEWGGMQVADQRIRSWLEAAIDQELTRDGLQRVDTDAELRVVARVAFESPLPITVDAFDYGGWPGWGGWSHWVTRDVELAELPERALMVDLIDVETHRLVWRGLATRAFPRGAIHDSKRLNDRVGRIFEMFPRLEE